MACQRYSVTPDEMLQRNAVPTLRTLALVALAAAEGEVAPTPARAGEFDIEETLANASRVME